jgi:hypothetical protein
VRYPGREFEGVFADRGGESECAARNPLAVRTVAGVDHERRSHDLVAEFDALTAPFDRESDVSGHDD